MSKRTMLVVGLLSAVGGTLAISAQDRAAPDATAEARLKLATEGYEIASKLYVEGRAEGPDRVLVWSGRLMNAERDAGGDAAKAAQDHLDRMKGIEQIAAARREAARATYLEVLEARYAIAETEASLAKAKPAQP